MTKLDQICETISERIESGELHEGERLPSESKLANGFGVSVGTVQKALERLAHRGLIRREQGRGTFVFRSHAASDVNYLRFRDAQGNELPNFIEIHAIRHLRKAGPWGGFLGPSDGYVRIDRRMNVGGRFDMFGEFWMRHADFEKIASSDRSALSTNLRVLIARRLGLPTVRIEQEIQFRQLPTRVAAVLGIGPECPSFSMVMRGYTVDDQPLFVQQISAGPFSESLQIIR